MKPQLAVIRGSTVRPDYNGMIVELITAVGNGCAWYGPDSIGWLAMGDSYAVESLGKKFDAPKQRKKSQFTLINKARIFPINDNPGNEAWVTEARKKLKPTEITERGEVRV